MFAKNSKFLPFLAKMAHIFCTHDVKILLIRERTALGIHQRHKISSKSLKVPAGIALTRGGDAY